MDVIEIENIFQQQFVKDINEKLKEVLGNQPLLPPIDVENMEFTIAQHSKELEVIKEGMENHTILLNEIKSTLEKLSDLVEEINKPKGAWRIK